MDDQAPAWNVPSTDGGSRWHHKILHVTSKGELKEHHRGLSMTAQKQALSTSSIQAGVYSVGLQTVRRSPPRTIQRIVAGCKLGPCTLRGTDS